MSSHASPANSITLLFPLYKSKPFIDNLATHFRQFTAPGINIIVSDRHCYDDSLEVLKQQFQHDSRVTFLSASDGINWVDHFNLLIGKVTGKYFSFVFHDDRYPPEYFDVLVDEMEKRQGATLAFSKMHVAGDRDWIIDHSIFSIGDKYPLHARQYLQLLYSNRIGVAFRGVFRTSTIHNETLLIKQNEKVSQYQDYYWIFALMVRGEFIYTERTYCTKHFRNEGASGKWNHQQFFRSNAAARKMIYEYVFTSTLPMLVKLGIYSGLELRSIKVRVSKMLKPKNASVSSVG